MSGVATGLNFSQIVDTSYLAVRLEPVNSALYSINSSRYIDTATCQATAAEEAFGRHVRSSLWIFSVLILICTVLLQYPA